MKSRSLSREATRRAVRRALLLACDLTLGRAGLAGDRGRRARGGLGRSGGFRRRGRLAPGLLGGLLDRWVAGRGPRGPALGPAWGASGGFRRGGRRAEGSEKLRKPRRTRSGDSRGWGRDRSHGSRASAATRRARRSWVYEASTSQVHRSACSGWRGRGIVQPRVCLANRMVCSRSKRRI
jgi:hypothetical protein